MSRMIPRHLESAVSIDLDRSMILAVRVSCLDSSISTARFLLLVTFMRILDEIVAALSTQYGVANEVVVMALLMNMGAMISPVAQPQLYLACDLGDKTELADYVKFSFKPLWVMNILWLVFGWALGIFR